MLILATLSFIPLCFLSLAAITFLFASITWVRQFFQLFSPSEKSATRRIINTALYCGRVSHTRYHPVVHSFSYPLFFCLLDLSEVEVLFGEGSGPKPRLWPFNFLMTFRDEDHLKNGEGLKSENHTDNGDNSLPCRVRRLVSERTGGKCNPSPGKFIHNHISCYITNSPFIDQTKTFNINL